MNLKKEGKLSMTLSVMLAASIFLNLGLASLKDGGVQAFQGQGAPLSLYEGRVIDVRPDEYIPFDVEVVVDGAPTVIACKPSGRAAGLCLDGGLGEGDTVLVAVDLGSRAGVVIDVVYNSLIAEHSGQTDDSGSADGPQDEGAVGGASSESEGESPQSNDGGQANQTDEPAGSSLATVELMPGVRLVVGLEPGPTPWLQAPEGCVKLTVACQPAGVEGITLHPPPGVYFVEKGERVLFSCVSVNPGWEFRDWCISKGPEGSTRKLGAGPENLTRVLINVDTVVTAFHSEVL